MMHNLNIIQNIVLDYIVNYPSSQLEMANAAYDFWLYNSTCMKVCMQNHF